MAKIVVDFQDTLKKTEQIYQLAGNVRTIKKNSIDTVYENVPMSWTGDGAERYQKKLNKIGTRIQKRAMALEKNASGLRASVKRLQRAEEYAKLLFLRK